jgi:uncharacterized membrane protein YeaQ/YmgE (transglycosylase-associated protein family)
MEVMTILSWLLFGLIIGAIAKLIMPGKDPGGWLVTSFIGVVGAFFGGYFGSLFGYTTAAGSWTMGSIVTAVVGSVLLLVAYRMFFRRSVRR